MLLLQQDTEIGCGVAHGGLQLNSITTALKIFSNHYLVTKINCGNNKQFMIMENLSRLGYRARGIA